MQPQPRSTKDCQEPREAGRGSTALPTTRFQTPSLQNEGNKCLLFGATEFVALGYSSSGKRARRNRLLSLR